MKAPLSKKAKLVLSSRKAVESILDTKSKGNSIHNLKVEARNGHYYSITTSERNLR